MAKTTSASPASAKSGRASKRGTQVATSAAVEKKTPDEPVTVAAPAGDQSEKAASAASSTESMASEPAGSTTPAESGNAQGANPPDEDGAQRDTLAASEQNTAPEPDAEAAPAGLSALLVNHSSTMQHLKRLRISLAPGAQQRIEFRDEAHKAACEQHIAALRSLHRWPEGAGLHWGAEA